MFLLYVYLQSNDKKVYSTIRNRQQEELLKIVKERQTRASKPSARAQEPISQKVENTRTTENSSMNFVAHYETPKSAQSTAAEIAVEKLKADLQRANL